MQNNKNVLTVVVVVVAIIVIWILYSILGGSSTESTRATVTNNGGTTETADTPASNYERTTAGAVIVRYTNSGFSPKNITVGSGSSVHFVNESNMALSISPADAVNEPYATFDQSKSIGKGQSYDYTFTTIGSYTYYDLNNPEFTGKITVK